MAITRKPSPVEIIGRGNRRQNPATELHSRLSTVTPSKKYFLFTLTVDVSFSNSLAPTNVYIPKVIINGLKHVNVGDRF